MRFFRLVIPFFGLLAVGSCAKKTEEAQSAASRTPGPEAEITYKVVEAPEWTALFNRTSGWFGGDGIFAIPFTGVDAPATSQQDSILFVFSDTMFGQIRGGKLQPGYKMVNNSVMVLKGTEPASDQARFLVHQNTQDEPVALFVPKTPLAERGQYYWLGDGFVNHHKDSSLYIFAYRIRNTNTGEAFPFREVGNAVIAIPQGSKYPFQNQRQLDLTFFTSSETDAGYTSFGAGVLANTAAAGAASPDEFIYVYGIRGKAKELVAARVSPSAFENFSGWQFWDGTTWTLDAKNLAPIEDSVSNEMSVTPIGKNKYALIYQYGGILPTLYMQIGPTPVGPFGPRQKIWNTSVDIRAENLFTYNAKAHPAISKPGQLLVSYNVNSFKFFEQIKEIPNLYRPRFIKIVFDQK